ncbi:hypothetical protein DFJ58DRAFT_742004 [Suillus subalutaceus]|uniref:uncharacterized protein n=1 Tax=Suillus subalutaceus TaxID=48586 RepID=UPI001B87774C|nr:uncharacterized protein DFJ58DRAFT_742004 [Suillus subalutaceus]KAG1871206.1 hypothetical protein DFJ58DRAFT_742004 [Suillus subalutaceus]
MSFSFRTQRGISPPPVYAPHSTIQTSSTTLRPYLQLPHILSLAWLAYPILSLIFVIFRLQLSSQAAQAAVANAKGDLLTACQAAEQAATAAASAPRYMAIASNQLITDTINGSMNDARAALILSLTVMEAIINFLIDIYRSTFLCFLELIVGGGLALLIAAVQEITSFLQSTLTSIVSGLQNDATSLNSAITTIVNELNKVNPFGNINAPQFNVSSLNSLSSITIPTDFENALIQLNNSLPTVSSIKNSIESLVDTPFEAVKSDINSTFQGLVFDVTTLPVPAQNSVSFCNDLDTSSVDDLGNDLLMITKIGTIILILLLFALLAGHCALEWYKWHCLQIHLRRTRAAWVSDPTTMYTGSASAPSVTLTDHNLLVLQTDAQHPLLTRIANTLSAKLRMSPSQHTHLRWFLHYIFHAPALACFLIGFFGLLSVQVQLLAVGPLEAKYTAQAAASVQDLSSTIFAQVNSSMYNQSSSYAGTINARIETAQSSVNDGLFGWVNGTTTTLNTTLNNFYTDVQNIVASVFNGTVLENTAQDFVRCIIGSKVDALEEALTFLNENLNVDLPTVNETVLVLSSSDVNEITQPIATAAIGGGQSDSGGLVGDLVATYVDSLKQERIMFALFLILWGVVVLMGLAVVFWHSYARNWVEAYKKRKWRKEQRDDIDDIIAAFPNAPPIVHISKDAEKGEKTPDLGLRSFTPLSEPRSAFSLNPFSRSANHPLKSLEPRFEKSWDSFFRQGAEPKVEQTQQPSIFSRTISRLGKRKQDDDSGDREEVEDEQPKSHWFKPVTNLFAKKAAPSEEFVVSRPIGRPPRPQLTISTAHSSSFMPDDLPHIERSPTREEPPSAWSISPTPPSRPWTKNAVVATKNPALPSISFSSPPLHPEQRRKASVPTDVEPFDEYGFTPPQAKEPSPLAMPLHHAFERAPLQHATVPLTLYPSQVQAALLAAKNKPAMAPPQPGLVPSSLPESVTPVSRLLTTAHARKSSNTINPFATPFDDDAYAVSPTQMKRTTNPFAGFAL